MSLDFTLESAEEFDEECMCPTCGHTHTNKVRKEYFSSNITHNLNTMFEAAGLYQILWHGDGQVAGEVLPQLEQGLADMKALPKFYETFNASNGWGLYKNAVPWLEEIVKACREYPKAVLHCSR